MFQELLRNCFVEYKVGFLEGVDIRFPLNTTLIHWIIENVTSILNFSDNRSMYCMSHTLLPYVVCFLNTVTKRLNNALPLESYIDSRCKILVEILLDGKNPRA